MDIWADQKLLGTEGLSPRIPDGPQGDGYEDAQGPHVKAAGAQRLRREAVALHMGEAHRSKLLAADSQGADEDCGLCGRPFSSCSCDFGV
jgi:hypothetical protein